MERPIFRLILLEYARDFIKSLPPDAREKIYYNIGKIQAGIKDIDLFKKLENTEIWEFRTSYHGIAYRLFAFWDKDEETLVVATNGIIKKRQKTPGKDIKRAEELRKQYFESKHK